MSSDFDINSIDRFTKRSTRLIFEQPCEVPAGCGGLVFRWTNPDDGLPIRFTVTCVGVRELYLNGQHLERNRARLPFGPVVIGIHVHSREEKNDFGMDYLFDWLAVTGTHLTVGWSEVPTVDVLSTDTDDWWMTTEDPGDDWNSLEASNDGWTALAPSEMEIEQVEEKQRWRFRYNEARPLALPAVDEMWIRKRTVL